MHDLLLLLFTALTLCPLAFFWCCCDTPVCLIFSDTYDTDLSLYTAGNFAVAAGEVSSSTPNDELVPNRSMPGTATAFQAAVDIKPSSTTATTRLFFARVDANNSWFVQVTPGASLGTLEVYERVAGVDTLFDVAIDIQAFKADGIYWNLSVCYSPSDGGQLTAIMTPLTTGGGRSTGGVVYTIGAVTFSSTKVALGCGAGAGTRVFDNLVIERTEIDLEGCGDCQPACERCLGGIMPDQVQVDVSGLVSGMACGDCEDLNGTYILTRTTNCDWVYELDSPICGLSFAVLLISNIGISNDSIGFLFCDDPVAVTQFVLWRRVFTSAPIYDYTYTNCIAWDQYDPFDGRFSSGGCPNGLGAVALLTALP